MFSPFAVALFLEYKLQILYSFNGVFLEMNKTQKERKNNIKKRLFSFFYIIYLWLNQVIKKFSHQTYDINSIVYHI